jgi:hypothetical protein
MNDLSPKFDIHCNVNMTVSSMRGCYIIIYVGYNPVCQPLNITITMFERQCLDEIDVDATLMFDVLDTCCSEFRHVVSGTTMKKKDDENELLAVDAVNKFIAAGGCREVTNKTGMTMLQVAIEGQCPILVGVLLDAGVLQAREFKKIAASDYKEDHIMLRVFLRH